MYKTVVYMAFPSLKYSIQYIKNVFRKALFKTSSKIGPKVIETNKNTTKRSKYLKNATKKLSFNCKIREIEV